VTADETFVVDNLLNLWEELRAGAAAVVARTVSAGPPPGAWSNVERTSQRLELAIEEVLCGTAGPTATVELPVVEGSRIAGPDPALADWIATPGARALHVLPSGRPVDEELVVLPATERIVALVRGLCDAPLPPGPGSATRLVAGAAASARLPPAVLDVVDGGRLVARLVSTGRDAAAYAGVRAQRLARDRPPDAVVTADELQRALRGDATALPPELVRALAAAGDVLRRTGALQ
jgi:hypothetical protein